MAAKPIKHRGKWRIRWFDAGGNRCSEVLNTYKGAEAQLRRRLVEAEKIQTGLVKAPAAPVTFGAFAVDRWLAADPIAQGNRPGSIYEKRCHLTRFLVPELGGVVMTQVAGEVVDRLFAALREKYGLAPKTIKNVRATLHRILVKAKDWGVIGSIPELPAVKVPEQGFDFMLPEESARLLAAARSDEDRALILFALHTGARAGEQLGLEWGDLDLVASKVRIIRSEGPHGVGPTKSGKGRTVPLTPELVAALRGLRHLRGDRVFCQADGSAMTHSQLRNRLNYTLKRAGLRRLRWHDMRHTFASQLIMANVPIKRVQEWLGHSTIQMTMRYAHLAPGGADDLIRALGGATGPTVAPPISLPATRGTYSANLAPTIGLEPFEDK